MPSLLPSFWTQAFPHILSLLILLVCCDSQRCMSCPFCPICPSINDSCGIWTLTRIRRFVFKLWFKMPAFCSILFIVFCYFKTVFFSIQYTVHYKFLKKLFNVREVLLVLRLAYFLDFASRCIPTEQPVIFSWNSTKNAFKIAVVWENNASICSSTDTLESCLCYDLLDRSTFFHIGRLWNYSRLLLQPTRCRDVKRLYEGVPLNPNLRTMLKVWRCWRWFGRL